MHTHRARGVPAGCWTHPRGDPVLLAPPRSQTVNFIPIPAGSPWATQGTRYPRPRAVLYYRHGLNARLMASNPRWLKKSQQW